MFKVFSKDDFEEGLWTSDFEKYPNESYEFMYKGYNCSMERNFYGNWCGYCQLPNDHPDFNKSYFDLDEMDVHGGLTYSALGKFGFDCSHARDIFPVRKNMDVDLNYLLNKEYTHYWTYEEVKKEIEKMVDLFIERQYI